MNFQKNLIKNNIQFFLLVLLSSCSVHTNRETKTATELRPSPLVDLIESTHIISTLISQNRVASLLENHDPEQLTLLLDNKSPAQMAFETEILSATAPLVVGYYFQKSDESNQFIKQLEDLAYKYDGIVKFVVIDADRLFSLVDDAGINKLPAILFVKNREIIYFPEETLNLQQLEQQLLLHIVSI